MTDTRTFYTIAIDRKTGRVRRFFGIHSLVHNKAAKRWLRSL